MDRVENLKISQKRYEDAPKCTLTLISIQTLSSQFVKLLKKIITVIVDI